jgi:hypothetical protein
LRQRALRPQLKRDPLGSHDVQFMMTTALQRSRKLLGIGAWVLLAAVALGFLTSIPTVDATLDRASGALLVRLVMAVILTVVGAAAIATWAGAVWHARVTQQSSKAGRRALLALLVLGNFVAGFFYYFGYVYWARSSTGEPAA